VFVVIIIIIASKPTITFSGKFRFLLFAYFSVTRRLANLRKNSGISAVVGFTGSITVSKMKQIHLNHLYTRLHFTNSYDFIR